MWKSLVLVVIVCFGGYLGYSQAHPQPNPESYKKTVRPFSPHEDRFPDPSEYCYDGVVYIGFWYGNASWGSAKFDSKTKQVVTCK